MTTFIFKGWVAPKDVSLTLDYRPSVSRPAVDDERQVDFDLEIADGLITISATVDDFDDSIPDRLYLVAHDLAKAATDVASFRDGVAYLPYIDEVVSPQGVTRRLILADRELGDASTVFNPENLEMVMDLVLTDVPLARALSDTVTMLSWSHYAPIAAGRVADSIVRMLTGARSPQAWRTMHETLRVDRAYVQLLSDNATPPRHGDRVAVSGDLNKLLAHRAWTLTDRYLAYLVGGRVPLDPIKYPLLSGETSSPTSDDA